MTADSIPARVRAELDSHFRPGELIPVDDLMTTCDFLYNLLLEIWVDVVAEEVRRFLETVSASVRPVEVDNLTGFIVDGRLYCLRAGVSPIYSRLLQIGFRPAIERDRKTLISTEIDLEGGRYNRLAIHLDRSQARLRTVMEETSTEVITAGERWIEAFALTQLANLNENPLAHLYSLVRRSLPEALAQSVRLYLLDPKRGGGIYMDQEARRHSLVLLKEGQYDGSERSPIELLAGLVIARFPISETVAREIVPQMITVAKAPLEVPSGTRIGLAQTLIYGSKGLILQPLVRSDRLWIEAAYPQQFRGEIEAVLRSELEAIRMGIESLRLGAVNDTSSLASSKRRNRSRHETVAEKAASLAGRFSGRFLAEYMRHGQ